MAVRTRITARPGDVLSIGEASRWKGSFMHGFRERGKEREEYTKGPEEKEERRGADERAEKEGSEAAGESGRNEDEIDADD